MRFGGRQSFDIFGFVTLDFDKTGVDRDFLRVIEPNPQSRLQLLLLLPHHRVALYRSVEALRKGKTQFLRQPFVQPKCIGGDVNECRIWATRPRTWRFEEILFDGFVKWIRVENWTPRKWSLRYDFQVALLHIHDDSDYVTTMPKSDEKRKKRKAQNEDPKSCQV